MTLNLSSGVTMSGGDIKTVVEVLMKKAPAETHYEPT